MSYIEILKVGETPICNKEAEVAGGSWIIMRQKQMIK